MKTKTKSTQSKKSKNKGKKKYKVHNRPEYNQMLVNRGNIFFWIDQAAQDGWHEAENTGKRGAPKQYSDSAIITCLTLKSVFSLTLRAVEGFVDSLFQLMRIDLISPDYTTLSIRAGKLNVDIHTQTDPNDTETALHIVVDSSGAKVYGEGEWKVRRHGWCKRRTWRKFHLAVDAGSKRLKATEMTDNDTADCEMLPTLLNQVVNPIDKVSADGAYDRRMCYEALDGRSIMAAIPPQQNARIWQHGNTHAPPFIRDENLRRIREIGRAAWKTESGYHRRSIAENAVFRLKNAFGERLYSRIWPNQRTEILLKCRILNQMADIGLPITEVVA